MRLKAQDVSDEQERKQKKVVEAEEDLAAKKTSQTIAQEALDAAKKEHQDKEKAQTDATAAELIAKARKEAAKEALESQKVASVIIINYFRIIILNN